MTRSGTSAHHALLLVLASAGLLAACGGSDDIGSSTGDTVAPRQVTTPQTRHDMANGCYRLREVGGRLVARDGDQRYVATATGADSAEPFYLKPTALGRYLLSARDGSLMRAGDTVSPASAPSDASDWHVDGDGRSGFRLRPQSDQRFLAVAPETGRLILSTTPSLFRFEPATGCTAYPEITVNARGDSFSGTLPGGAVLGFADAHVHISATDFLGGAHYGNPFHRFGVAHALGDCKERHGEDGREDLVGNLYATDPLASHDTQGWPTFVSWPAAHALTHEGMYYKWVERAWKAGLRIMVNELVENEVLCTLNSTLKGRTPRCNEMDSATAQVQTMRDLQDYIDAQEGGPGKGWFRLVTTPADARQVIAQGKLAVVLGVEISHLFNCTVRYGLLPVLPETQGCDPATVDAQLERLHALGVRQLFPVHEFDNALGGNGIFDGLVLNFGNKLDTGQFWQTYDCPEDDYFYEAGAIMTTVPGAFDNDDPLSTLLRQLAGGTAPVYKSSKRQCNARSITPVGRYAIERMMDRGMIIDLDHLELKMKSEVIDMARARNYPLTSTHGGHGGISMTQARDIFRLGGLIYDYKGNGKGFVSSLNKARAAHAASGTSHAFAFGFGADTNGMGAQADPRGRDARPVSYPFTLFSGADWGSDFNGIKPVVFERQRSGERVYDTDRDGQAHYGLIADWVEEVRLEGGREALTPLYRSAEVYLQMWERALANRQR